MSRDICFIDSFLERYERVAKGATPGQWRVRFAAPDVVDIMNDYAQDIGTICKYSDAAFIETFDPPAALAMCQEIRNLRKQLEECRASGEQAGETINALRKENALLKRKTKYLADEIYQWEYARAEVTGEKARGVRAICSAARKAVEKKPCRKK